MNSHIFKKAGSSLLVTRAAASLMALAVGFKAFPPSAQETKLEKYAATLGMVSVPFDATSFCERDGTGGLNIHADGTGLYWKTETPNAPNFGFMLLKPDGTQNSNVTVIQDFNNADAQVLQYMTKNNFKDITDTPLGKSDISVARKDVKSCTETLNLLAAAP
jgi:hypothetical protein